MGAAVLVFPWYGWKLSSGGKIRNFPLSSCTFVSQENAISSKVFSPILKKLSFCWKMWKIGIRANKRKIWISWAQKKFYFNRVCNGKIGEKFHGRNFFWWKNSKFPTFKLYTVSEKMLYHQGYSADFQKLSICWKMWKIGIRAKNFMGATILVLQW